MTADQAAVLLLKARSNYYEQGDKAGRLLAHQLRQNVASYQIPRIQTSSDIMIDPQRINDEFRDYYASLYTSETSSDTQDLDNFFTTLKIPSSAYTKKCNCQSILENLESVQTFFDLQTYSTLAPLTANHVFPPSLVDGKFTIWSNQGIKTFKDLYIHNTFASFQQLSDTFALPSQHFFRRLILLMWKSPISPSHTLWLKEVLNSAKLEKIRYILRGSLGKFHKMWNPFYRYIRELDMPDVSVHRVVDLRC
ncbi:hypothetical protein F7725_017504 [Dissostichus mawsoni]|uniref:Uncharacterized protein n=1 Tax=Dissostichus mawsoni TaxID=36200 RepID=A0A7J5Z6I9_DISMA|nr:hypothetical protein F7725_017504 [Dissostichus mawsoni]